jgi:hypothetical protein
MVCHGPSEDARGYCATAEAVAMPGDQSQQITVLSTTGD